MLAVQCEKKMLYVNILCRTIFVAFSFAEDTPCDDHSFQILFTKSGLLNMKSQNPEISMCNMNYIQTDCYLMALLKCIILIKILNKSVIRNREREKEREREQERERNH